MQHFTQVIDGIDGSRAELVGYVIDNSPEMDPDRRRPAILIIPGGGYAIGSDRESEPVALQFLAAGYQAFVLKYSCVPSRYPVALLEMAEACELPKRLLQQTLHKMASDILHQLDAAIALVETDNPAELAYLARYRDDVEHRCHHFQAQATLLPELQL